jgi:hypothetical protein
MGARARQPERLGLLLLGHYAEGARRELQLQGRPSDLAPGIASGAALALSGCPLTSMATTMCFHCTPIRVLTTAIIWPVENTC